MSEILLHDFLKHLQQVKTDDLTRIQHELELLEEDCKQVEENLASLKNNSIEPEQTVEQIGDVTPSTSTDTKTNTEANKLQSIIANKKRIVHRYFDELSQTYVQAHNTDLKDFNIKGNKSLLTRFNNIKTHL